MTSDQSDRRQRITMRSLSRAVLEKIAPGELPSFDLHVAAVKAILPIIDRGWRRAADPTGFGAGAEGLLITGVISVVSAVLARFGEQAIDGTRKGILRWIRRRRGRHAEAVPAAGLDAEQLAKARLAAYTAAVKAGVRRKRAALIAEETVRILT